MLEAARRADRPFDLAWNRAVREITWPHHTERRHDWRDALAATRDEWRAAYEGEPTAFSAAASMLLEAGGDEPGPPGVVTEARLAAA